MRALFSSVAIGLALLLAGAGVGRVLSIDESPEVIFLSVGQGDCTVIRDAGAVIMIDAGPKTEDFDAGARLIAPKIHRMGIDRVDLVFLTHPDSDHIGGLAGIARSIPVSKIAAPAHFRANVELLHTLREAGVSPDEVLWISEDLRFDIGPLRLTVSVPTYEPGESENEGSLFVKAELGDSSVVMSGDASAETELQMAGRFDWSCDILKAGHHGSRGSTGLAWLRESKPKAVVASCGRENPYGHPAPEVANRVRAQGAQLLRTDTEGDIRFRLDPEGPARILR